MALTNKQANHLRNRGVYTAGTHDTSMGEQGGIMQTGGQIVSTQEDGWRELLLSKSPGGKFGGS